MEKPDGWLAGWWLVFGKAVEINRVLPNKYVTYRHYTQRAHVDTTLCRTRALILLLEAGRIQHLIRRSLPHYPQFLAICLSCLKSSPSHQLRSRMVSHREGALCLTLLSSRTATMPAVVIRRFLVIIDHLLADSADHDSCCAHSHAQVEIHADLTVKTQIVLGTPLSILNADIVHSVGGRVKKFSQH